MTKDYYNILGVGPDATDDEIRARWVELVKKYHIDFESGEFDEKVKDVNDAYHVLKNPATRLEYDMERTFKKKKRESAFKKWGLRVGLAVVLIILCSIYFEKPEFTRQLLGRSQPVSVSSQNQKRLPISESRKAPVAQAAKEEASNLAQVSSPTRPQGGTGMDQKEHGVGLAGQKQGPLPEASKLVEARSGAQETGRETIKEASKETKFPALSGEAKLGKAAQPAREASSGSKPRDTDKASQADRSDRGVAQQSPTSKTVKVAPVEKVAKVAQVNKPSPSLEKLSFTNPDPSSSLLAREDELTKFFLNYTAAYNRGDVDAFVALFSPRAVQNSEENIGDIKGTYRRFFSQSQELHYQLQDLKFEIYRNGVEATARYVLDQVSKRNGVKQTWRGTARWALIRENGDLRIISLDYKHQESL